MHQILFKAGPITIYWYGVMMALGFMAGLWNWVYLGRKEGRDAAFCSDLLFWIMLAGILGARTLYVLANLDSFILQPISIFRIDQGGLIFYGGFLGAGLAIALFARRRHVKLLSLLDFAVTSLPLGHAFGRIGCLLNGCCFGKTCHTGPTITFPRGSLPWFQHVDSRMLSADALRSLPVCPTQIYSSLANILIFFVLFYAYSRRKHDGEILGLYLVIYPFTRFMIEFMRVSEKFQVGPLSLSGAQYLCLGLGSIGGLLLYRARWKKS